MEKRHSSPEVPHAETTSIPLVVGKGNSVSAPATGQSVQHPQTSAAALLASIKGPARETSFRKTGISQAIQEFQKFLAQPVSEIIARECEAYYECMY